MPESSEQSILLEIRSFSPVVPKSKKRKRRIQIIPKDIYPITIPEKLPIKITPCPIVEAILEIRFVSNESWTNIPGLLYPHIREKYTRDRKLPLADWPEEMRRQDPDIVHMPLLQYFNDQYIIQIGPRVIGLMTIPNTYPGWAKIEAEMTWLIAQIQKANFITEGERLAVRYIDFFPKLDIFENISLDMQMSGKALTLPELNVATVLRKDKMTARLAISNSVIGIAGKEPTTGSLFDLDVWLGPQDFDLFQNGMEKFGAIHTLVKQTFFGLLKPDFLATLKPSYT